VAYAGFDQASPVVKFA